MATSLPGRNGQTCTGHASSVKVLFMHIFSTVMVQMWGRSEHLYNTQKWSRWNATTLYGFVLGFFYHPNTTHCAGSVRGHFEHFLRTNIVWAQGTVWQHYPYKYFTTHTRQRYVRFMTSLNVAARAKGTARHACNPFKSAGALYRSMHVHVHVTEALSINH